MENLTRADSRLLPGFGPGQGIVSGQGVRFPLLIQVTEDKDLGMTGLGDEDFVAKVAKWDSSEEATAAKRTSEFAKQLEG